MPDPIATLESLQCQANDPVPSDLVLPELAVELFRPREALFVAVDDVGDVLRQLVGLRQHRYGGIVPVGLVDLAALPPDTLLAVRLLEPLRSLWEATCEALGGLPAGMAESCLTAAAALSGGSAPFPRTTREEVVNSLEAELLRSRFRLRFTMFVDTLAAAYSKLHGGEVPLFVMGLHGKILPASSARDGWMRIFMVLGHPRLVFLTQSARVEVGARCSLAAVAL